MSFIKNIVNKLRINKIINRFNKLIRYYRFALTRSDEIVVEGEIVELSKTISEFDSIRINNVLDEYNRLLNDVKEHNEYLIQL